MSSLNSRKVDGGQSLSVIGFHVLMWSAFVVCSIACALRLYVRRKCFGHFLADDWIMLFAFAILFSVVIVSQLFVPEANAPPGKEHLEHFQQGLIASGAAMIAMYVGVWAIKLNFLLFFKRLGSQLTVYVVAWYIVLVITVGSGAVTLGVQQYHCIFGSWAKIANTCSRPSDLKRTQAAFDVSWILDVITDALIICFPISILWRVRIGMKQKFMLAFIFSLVAFTIAVTVVRGTVVGVALPDVNIEAPLNINWVWLYVEYSVSFLIACIVSFRALFARRENLAQVRAVARQDHQTPPNHGMFQRVRQIHDSLLESFGALETLDDVILPVPNSGRFSSSFLAEAGGTHVLKDEDDSKDPSVIRQDV